MKKALIIGGTGLIGKELTSLLLADKRYAKVILFVRKPRGRIHEKLEQVTVNFNEPTLPTVAADEMFCCIGTTIKKAGSKAEFYKVDHDYAITTARAGLAGGIQRFAMVSSMGANKKSPVFYNKTKGQTEDDIINIGFKGVYIFRPSLLLGKRKEFRLGELIAQFIMVKFSFIIPARWRAVKASQVARAMINSINNHQQGVHIFESDEIALL